jgi:hypothetical protein
MRTNQQNDKQLPPNGAGFTGTFKKLHVWIEELPFKPEKNYDVSGPAF